MGIPNELIRAVRQRRVVPFVGAGVSAGVKRGLFPSPAQLADQLAAELADQALPEGAQEVRRLAAAKDYLQAAEVACRELRPHLFNRVLRARFRVRRPEGADLDVVQALWSLEPPLVITTSYDDVLRWGCPRDAEVIADDQDEELALLHEASSASPRVWHLYGTIHRLGTILLAGADYRRLYADEGLRARAVAYESALLRIGQTLADRPFLFVGLDLGDPYVTREIEHVLALTKGKSVPSYALMKKGAGDAAALRSNFNVQLVEHEDHGRPLAELLREIAYQAFHPVDALPTAPDPAPPQHVRVPRAALEDAYAGDLRASGRLLVLAPRRGGAKSLTRSLAARHFGHRVTWLTPPDVPGCTAQQYWSALSGEPAVDDPLKAEAWLRLRARAMGGDHLIVLRHDGGPIDHLSTLGDTLRKLLGDGRGAERFFVLAAGSAPCAHLIYNTSESSLFSGAPVRHVPPLTEAEVRASLDAAGLDGAASAADVHRATGGHPGLVEEAVLGRGAIGFEALTDRLSRSPAVRGAIVARLSEDDRDSRHEKRHARWALREMLAGRPVRKLAEVEDQLQFAEARLYYDGLVVAGDDGATVFRCEAARRAAERALAVGDAT
jgi:hypothetical protein